MPTVEAAKRLEAERQLAAAQEALAVIKAAEPKEEWHPEGKTPIGVSIAVGVMGSLAPAALTMIPMPWGGLVAILLGGVAAGLATHFGIKSAGVPKTPGK